MTADEKAGTVADLVIDRLAQWGAERIYGYAGDGNNPLLGALRRADGPVFVGARHEEAAAFMACGEAKYGGVGVVTSTQGPGAVHLLNGLYDARLDSVPVVAIVAQQHRTALGSGYQQEIDLQTLFHDVAASSVQLVATPEQVPMVVDRAFRTARAGGRPAVVILPHDVQTAPAPDLGQSHGEVVTSPRWTTGRILPREEDVAAAAEVIAAGERVAILAGRGARDAGAELVRLAEHLGAPVATSLFGKPFVDEEHPLAVGTMGHLGTDASAHALQGCDTLVIVGSHDPWTEFYPAPGQARAVQIDVDPAALGDRYPVEVGVVGEAAAAIDELMERLPARGSSPWRDEAEDAARLWRETARRRAEVPADPLNPEQVVRAFAERIPASAAVALDVGSVVYHYARQTNLPHDVPVHLSSTLASMGCGVPYGIAAKELRPDRPVAVLSGDGAMQMLGNAELVTVAERWRTWADPRFVVLVLGNRDLAEVSWEQREMEGEPRFSASQDVPEFDAARYAELLGLRGVRVSSPDELSQAFSDAFAADRPVVIDAEGDPDAPLLPPLPHAERVVDGMRQALEAEGDDGAHALRLLDAYLGVRHHRSS
ncbi:MAG TPA: thiamine pyrophosphate-requiring protein [Microbacterium sp.]|nr:thiamine pyrophosphate-requiring protein [Microbacterium sp.]